MSVKFNPSRLKLARTRRQLTFKSLAQEVGLTPRMVSEYEKDYCSSEPPEATVEAFSRALNYPAEFLLDDDAIEEVAKETVSFRSLKSMKAAQEHAAIGAGQIGVLISEFFERSFNMLDVNVPDYRDIEPEVAAQMLRADWNLGTASISNMVHLLEKHGVRVFSLAENTQNVDAFSFWKGTTPYVFLNTQKSGERSRFDAAHELGHLILHQHNSPQGKDLESEADRFAAELLMPRATILPYKGSMITIQSILKLKHNWKVSAFALIVQMKNVGVLSEWQYKNLVIQASKMGLRTKEIDGIKRETSHVINKILAALSEDGCSIVDLAKSICLPVDEVSGLLFKCAVIPNTGSQPSNVTHFPKERAKLSLVK
ncbi:TPA: ImmA/IrrE family metallo-endopeptidase [Vibrio parahaemolyticus]|uniref:helix-turn-helix domain-containing protein n=1 Tax=Vibrio parahaemolyticus TaxID=670 RepID=UPI002361CBC8|nr:XRE family transcriptional regulator [Vibrio parahaemolyticus]HCG6603367.1 ImmA/IrrE family metallo-endopeptidase [Vibrio parahaemolyticus]